MVALLGEVRPLKLLVRTGGPVSEEFRLVDWSVAVVVVVVGVLVEVVEVVEVCMRVELDGSKAVVAS